jgi:hypothetical protein
MKLTVVIGEPPWQPGQTFDATFPVTLEVVWAEPPWQVGTKLTATMEEPQGDKETRPQIDPDTR